MPQAADKKGGKQSENHRCADYKKQNRLVQGRSGFGGSEYDAVVGRYSLDAPLPVLSALRCSLLDLAYSRLGFEAQGELPPLETLGDCYYDLSDATSKHLVTPFAMQEGIGLDEIFSGKTNRRLFVADSEIRDVKSRGGNTLVFNRKILKVPNWSLKVKDKIARRGDFFRVLKAKHDGFKIADVPFATKHNRGTTAFNFVKERGKLLRDLIGSSFTKAIEEVGMDTECEAFYKAYQSRFEERLTKFVCSFFRIQALLKMLKSFIPFEAEKFKTSSVMRAYQMFRYPTLSEDDFKRMIFRSYRGKADFLTDGWQNLDALVQRRHKEALHDDIVLALAQKHKPAKILDYGAGHCRIANALSLLPNREVCVYDIDMETIQKRAGEKVSILSETASLEEGTFDLILNNLVLCCIDEKTAESVMQEISRLLKLGGQAIFSICNPFFNLVQNTELRTTGLQGNYRITERFIKKTTIGTPERVDFHCSSPCGD